MYLRRIRIKPLLAAVLALSCAFGVADLGGPDSGFRNIASDFPDPSRVKDIEDLQIFRQTQAGVSPNGLATELVNLNPNVGSWYILRFHLSRNTPEYHLEVPPQGLSQDRPLLQLAANGIVIGEQRCALWEGEKPLDESSFSAAFQAIEPGLPFAPICDGRVWVRQKVDASTSMFSYISNVFGSSHLTSWIAGAAKSVPGVANRPENLRFRTGNPQDPASVAASHVPSDALLDRSAKGRAAVASSDTSLAVKGAPSALSLGHWYAQTNPGIFYGVMQPNLAEERILGSYGDRVDRSSSESSLVYLAAFDLSGYQVGYSIGTVEPNPNWALSPSGIGVLGPITGYKSPFDQLAKERKQWRGPDGLDDIAPLAGTGLVAPYLVHRLVSTFNAGYQRRDMAMDDGPLSAVNHSSHWGFVQDGVVMSRLQPGLATAVTFKDGSFTLMTWPENDRDLRERVKDARQNATAVIERYDFLKDMSVPGPYVGGAGYDSGGWHSYKIARIRSGVCIQELEGNRFLIFAYFPSAVPSTMTRLFQSYRCSYAMQLDINLTRSGRIPFYIHGSDGDVVGAEYLHSVGGDGKTSGSWEFVHLPDVRDFFYVLKK